MPRRLDRYRPLAVLLQVLLAGCAPPLLEYQRHSPAAVLLPVGGAPVQDGRARFRQIFCALLERRPGTDPADCDRYLLRLGDERPAEGARALPAHDTRLRLLIVPGALGECFGADALPYPEGVALLHDRGYRIDHLRVDGRSGNRHNAGQIAAYLEAEPSTPDERLVLVGYSKGANDILRALADHPEVTRQVSAVISIAGSINGSPLADRYDGAYRLLLAGYPFDDCGPGDGELIDSLKRGLSVSRLVQAPPPAGINYYSLGAFSDPAGIARIMRMIGSPDLNRADARNDGQTLYYDQVIPGATLLGYANADHWAVAIPMDVAKPFFAGNPASGRPYPRAILFEALVRYLAEDLAK